MFRLFEHLGRHLVHLVPFAIVYHGVTAVQLPPPLLCALHCALCGDLVADA